MAPECCKSFSSPLTQSRGRSPLRTQKSMKVFPVLIKIWKQMVKVLTLARDSTDRLCLYHAAFTVKLQWPSEPTANNGASKRKIHFKLRRYLHHKCWEQKNLKEEASVDQEYFLCKAWEGTGPIRWRLRWLIMYSWGRNHGLHPRLGR